MLGHSSARHLMLFVCICTWKEFMVYAFISPASNRIISSQNLICCSSISTNQASWHNRLTFTKSRQSLQSTRQPGRLSCRSTHMKMTQRSGDRSSSIQKSFVWVIWALYMHHIFLSDSPCGANGGEMCGITLPVTMEALNLSINFCFVTPIVFPSLAPIIHPALEGLFNIVIAWGGLFLGFLSDGRKQRVPMLPFLVGTAFLTNVFYLPYLALRQSFSQISAGNGGEQDVNPAVLKLAEGRQLPLLMTGIFCASVLWACFGRDGSGFGDVAARWAALQDMALHTDRLAHSFLVDCITFWGFQGYLIDDDLRRRGWTPAAGQVDPVMLAAAGGKYLPFFGLVWYLTQRPPLRKDVLDSTEQP